VKKVTWFIVVILSVVALSVATHWQAQQTGVTELNQQPWLSLDASEVTMVEIASATEATQIGKSDGRWLVTQKQGYPADTAKLAKLVSAISESKVVEQKTRLAKNYPMLGVSDLSAENSQAIQITLHTPDSSISLLIGKQNAGGTFVRKVEEAQSYLIDTPISPSTNPSQWIKDTMFDFGVDDVSKLMVSVNKDTQAQSFVVSKKTDASHFTLEPPHETKSLVYESILTGLVRNLVTAQVKDVEQVNSLSIDSQRESASFEIWMAEQKLGKKISLYHMEDDTYWLVVDGRKWAYKIESYVANQLNKPLQDYLKEAE
jgi:hypothetical protein